MVVVMTLLWSAAAQLVSFSGQARPDTHLKIITVCCRKSLTHRYSCHVHTLNYWKGMLGSHLVVMVMLLSKLLVVQLLKVPVEHQSYTMMEEKCPQLLAQPVKLW